MANLRVDKITSTETFETTGSVQFDGTGDYLDVTESNNDFDFDGDFTIEFWVYFNTVNARNDTVGSANNSVYLGASKSGWIASYYTLAGNKWHFSYQSNQAWIFEHTFSFTSEASRWYHVAFTREDSSIKCFVDGVQQGETKISSTTLTSTENSVRVGGGEGSTSLLLNGYVSNLRVIKGKALYTSNFKTPMRELEITPETTLLCCQSKTDASLEKTGKTITVNGNAVANELTPGILTPVPKAGGGSAITGSVEFTGSPSKLTADSVDFAMGSNDLTMECWFYNGVDTSAHLVQIDTSPTQSPSDITNFTIATRDLGSGDVRFLVRNDSNSNLIDLVSSTGLANINAWHHLAGTIEGTTARLFLNGVLIKSGTLSGTRTHTGQRLNIGANQTSRYLKGYLSNVRIVKGTALYTDSFIPPTRELKRVPGTVLLSCQDPDNPLTEATGKTITGYGDLQRTDDVELITNGSFAGDFTGWTNGNPSQFTYSTDSVGGDTSGKLKYVASDSNLRTFTQYVTCVTGQKYNLSFFASSNASNAMVIDIDGTNVVTIDNNSNANLARYNHIFTAGSASVRIRVESAAANTAYFDNFSVKLVDGSNKGSNFTPQVGDDRKVTFEGVTKINTDAYFYLPTGDTESRETTGTYNAGTRGIFCGGESPGSANSDRIEYITIASKGDIVDFGNLTVARRGGSGGCASHVRGLTGGGYVGPANNNVIDYFTIASIGNAVDFGDMTGTSHNSTAVSNETRGVWMGGYTPGSGSPVNTLQYVTISSTGNALDFGDLTRQVRGAASISSPVRGVCAGGAPSTQNTMDYITISTTGNANDFGDLTVGRDICAGGGNSKRGVIFMGRNPSMTNIIDYITIASMGNALDFGDSISSGYILSDGASSSRRVVFAGIMNPGYNTNMDFIEIATTGNAQDFGDHSTNQQFNTGLSNGHGGLG